MIDGWLPAQVGPGPELWAELLVMVVWALLLAVVVLFVVRTVLEPVAEYFEDDSEAEASEAMAILRERFARGEIDEEEFERRAAVLRRED